MKRPTNPKMRMTAPIIDATIATYFKSKSSVDTTRPLSNPVSVSSIDQIPAKQTPQTEPENGQALDRIRIDRTHIAVSIDPVNPVYTYKVEQIHGR